MKLSCFTLTSVLILTHGQIHYHGSCSDRPDGSLPCLNVLPCGFGGRSFDEGEIDGGEYSGRGGITSFSVNTLPGRKPATQPTSGSMCYNRTGIFVRLNATDDDIFSPYTKCNQNVYVNSDVLETFIGPVHSLRDSPQWYHEIDTSASGALWASCINNAKGSANTQSCDPAAAGTLNCTGLANFERGLTVKAHNSTDHLSWGITLRIPWAIFANEFQPQDLHSFSTYWPIWRLNFYRYDYPSGPPPAKFELEGWSPTHTGSFHEPNQFGYAVFVPYCVYKCAMNTRISCTDDGLCCQQSNNYVCFPLLNASSAAVSLASCPPSTHECIQYE
jgi:hypothetical protein